MKQKLTPSQRRRKRLQKTVLRLKIEGKTYKQIEQELEISTATAWNYVNNEAYYAR